MVSVMERSELFMIAITLMAITLIMPAFSAEQSTTLQSLQKNVDNLTSDQNGMFSWARGTAQNITTLQKFEADILKRGGMNDRVDNITDV